MTVLQTVEVGMLPQFSNPAAQGGRNETLMVTQGGQGDIELAGELTASYERIYESNPTCAAVVNKLTKQLATIPVRVYDRPSTEEAPEIINGHAVGDLLNRPIPRQGASYWKQGLGRQALVHGNGLLGKFRGNGPDEPPTGILTASWPYVAAWARLGSQVEFWSTFQTGEQRGFSADDGIHLAWQSGNLNGLGVSPLLQLAKTLRLDDGARRYQSSSFEKGVRPSGVISPPDGFRYAPGQKAELEAALHATQAGVDQAGRFMLLAPGFQWQQMSHTSAEAEVIAARGINREEIAMVYDVPPPMIGDLTHGTYSNVEELHRILYVTTLRPWFSLIEEVIQRQLIDMEPAWQGVYVQFDLSEILRGNRREEIDAMSQSYLNGITTLNEVRKELGYKRVDIPEADIPHIQANNMKPVGAGTNRGLVVQP